MTVWNLSLTPAQFSTQAGGWLLQATNDLDTFLQHAGLPMRRDHARTCCIRKQSRLGNCCSCWREARIIKFDTASAVRSQLGEAARHGAPRRRHAALQVGGVDGSESTQQLASQNVRMCRIAVTRAQGCRAELLPDNRPGHQ